MAKRRAAAGRASPRVARDGAGCQHAAHFYREASALHSRVASFVVDGLRRRHAALVIVDAPHREPILDRLREQVDVADLTAQGALVVCDARETLSRFLTGTSPDRARFRDAVQPALDAAMRSRPGPVHVFGDMVDLLWGDGQDAAAMSLENFWNDLARTRPLSLLCGYDMRGFADARHSVPFDAICRQHSHVACSGEGGADASGHAALAVQQRDMAMAQHHARVRELQAVLEQLAAERDKAVACEAAERADAESARRLQDEFLAILSHELRTPLNAILGWTHIGSQSDQDPAFMQRVFTIIQRNASRQRRVIDDLLDMSRLVTGRVRLQLEPAHMGRAVVRAIATVQPAADARGVTLRVDGTEEAATLRADRNRLQQMLWILLSNAIKFTPAGGEVRVRVLESDEAVSVEVADTGCGIAPEFMPYVFDRFRQQDSGPRRNFGGLGLGLSMVRHLAEAHGGRITAASPGAGAGATFTLTLPAVCAPAHEPVHVAGPVKTQR